MKQSKRGSAIESATNVISGIGVAFISQLVIYPLADIHVSTGTNVAITLIFTAISFIRNYLFRRLFDWWQHRVVD